MPTTNFEFLQFIDRQLQRMAVETLKAVEEDARTVERELRTSSFPIFAPHEARGAHAVYQSIRRIRESQETRLNDLTRMYEMKREARASETELC